MTFYTGYSQQAISPRLDQKVFLAGFGHNRLAESVHDDLYVRAIAIQSGGARLVLASLDLIGLSRKHCREIEKRVNQSFPGSRVIICCTHTHHGPDTIGLWGPNRLTSGVNPDYLALVKDRTVQTIIKSLQSMSESAPLFRAASIQVPKVVRNSRHPHILDQELVSFQFYNPDRTPRFTVVTFPCHPQVLWQNNPNITSDYPGYLRKEVELATNAPCVFFPGGLGGMLIPDVVDHSFQEAEQIGKILARAAISALLAEGGSKAIQVKDLNLEVHYTSKEYSIRLQNPLLRLAGFTRVVSNINVRRGAVITEVNLVRIGPLWIVTVPGELFPELGLTIKTELRVFGAQIATIIGLANDEIGYILPKEDFQFPFNPLNPGVHYEETMFVGNDVGLNLIDVIYVLL